MRQILDALDEAENKREKPTVIIAKTTKGKGVSYAENVVSYHGVAPKDGKSGKESLDKALEDIRDPKFTQEKVDGLLKLPMPMVVSQLDQMALLIKHWKRLATPIICLTCI